MTNNIILVVKSSSYLFIEFETSFYFLLLLITNTNIQLLENKNLFLSNKFGSKEATGEIS